MICSVREYRDSCIRKVVYFMSVRIKIKPLLWLAMLLMLVGCNGKLSLIKEAYHFYNSTISFPETMLRIENGDTATVSMSMLDRPLLIHYYSPEDCSECALNHMRDNIRLARYSKENGLFDFIVIIAPPLEDSIDIIEKATEMSLPLSLYVDSMHFFPSDSVIPSNSSLHTFLINTKNTPIYVGSPLANKSTKNRFERILRER